MQPAGTAGQSAVLVDQGFTLGFVPFLSPSPRGGEPKASYLFSSTKPGIPLPLLSLTAGRSKCLSNKTQSSRDAAPVNWGVKSKALRGLDVHSITYPKTELLRVPLNTRHLSEER